MNAAAEHSAPVTVTAPASKSLSHRYCIAAALADGVSTLRHVLDSADLARTRGILEAVGARLTRQTAGDGEDCWQVTGIGRAPQGGQGKPLSCNVGESGTTCRLLTAVLAAGHGLFRIHGEGRMHQRPLGELCQSLTALGAGVIYEGEALCPPLLLQAGGLDPQLCHGVTSIGMDNSSQYFSGLLLAAPFASSPLTIELSGSKAVSWPYVGLTLHCMEDFGIQFTVQTRPRPDAPWQELPGGAWRGLAEARPGCLRVRVSPGSYRPGDFRVEGDWSAASYLLAAGVLGKRPVRVAGLRSDSLQGDRALLDILLRMGARVEMEADAVTVWPSQLHGVSLDMGACPDLVPTVAVLAAFASGSTRISNVAHLRLKESDRIEAPATELAKLGVTLDQLSDGLLISGTGGLAEQGHGKWHAPHLPEGVRLSAHNDHRMAMSLALLELRDPGLRVRQRLDDPAVVSKSFPAFWDVWEQIL